MNEQDATIVAKKSAEIFRNRGIHYALVGGLAVGFRSRPRSTKDADFILSVPAMALPGLLEDFQALGCEFDLLGTIRQWSSERMIALYLGSVRIDWIQPVLPLYNRVLATALDSDVGGMKLRIATPEGLILTKMVAFRPQDTADMETLLAANAESIDLDFIRNELAFLAESDPKRMAWLEETIKRCVTDRLPQSAASGGQPLGNSP